MALVESAKDNDKVTSFDGFKFVINEHQTTYFENTQLDYEKNRFGFGGYTIVRQ